MLRRNNAQVTIFLTKILLSAHAVNAIEGSKKQIATKFVERNFRFFSQICAGSERRRSEQLSKYEI